MKKTILSVLILAGLTSCYKHYDCHCVYNYEPHGLKQEIQPITTSTKKQAKELCEEHGLGLYNDWFECELIY